MLTRERGFESTRRVPSILKPGPIDLSNLDRYKAKEEMESQGGDGKPKRRWKAEKEMESGSIRIIFLMCIRFSSSTVPCTTIITVINVNKDLRVKKKLSSLVD